MSVSSDKLSQDSFDPSIYSMESFDPSSNNEEFDPSDNEDDTKSISSSRDSWSSRRSGNYDSKIYKVHASLQEQDFASENQKLREERDTLNSLLSEEKVCNPRSD
jgi:hypothetical protein